MSGPASQSSTGVIDLEERATLALIADVHGNLPALEAVLADMLAFDVDGVVCLGDVASLGPEPAATLGRLRGLDPWTVMGNTDDYLLSPRSLADFPDPPPPGAREHLALEAWCAAQLGEGDKEYLRSFAPRLELRVGGLRVVAYHGSPRSYDDQVRSSTPDKQLDEWLEGLDADIYVGAHTHEQFAKRFRSSVLANPGSVGMAVRLTEAGDGWHPAAAEYALLQVVEGQPSLHLRKVAYDLGALRDAAARSGMPGVEWYLEQFREG